MSGLTSWVAGRVELDWVELDWVKLDWVELAWGRPTPRCNLMGGTVLDFEVPPS